MIKIVFDFKCIYTYACVRYYLKKNNNLTNNLYFYNKNIV